MASVQSFLPDIRFYTGLDPYYFAVDNRPLADLKNSVNLVSGFVDGAYDGAAALAAAVGFVTRGYALRAGAETEVMVGHYNHTGLNFILNHSFLVQQGPASSTVPTLVPKIGLQVQPKTFPLAAAASAGDYRVYAVDARVVQPADASFPWFDANNTSYTSKNPFEVGVVETTLVNLGDHPVGGTEPVLPGPASGWTRVVTIDIAHGESVITPDMIHPVAFKTDGAAFGGSGGSGDYELNIDRRIVGTSPGVVVDYVANTTTVSSLLTDANYSMVFINGQFQFGYEVLSSDSLRLPAALPAGTHLAFVSTAGGKYIAGNFREFKVEGSEGQAVFSNLLTNARYSMVFIDSVYQSRETFQVTGDNEITLNTPLEADADVFFVEITAGIADSAQNVPAGGTSGQVLTKTSNSDFEFSWQNPSTGSTLPDTNPVDVGRYLRYVGEVAGVDTFDWHTPASSVGPTPDRTEVRQEALITAMANPSSAQGDLSASVFNAVVTSSGKIIAPSFASPQVAIGTKGGRYWEVTSPANLPQSTPGVAINPTTGRIVVVGDNSSISYSDNEGVTWTPVDTSGFSSSTPTDFHCVRFSESEDLFIAVGTNGVVAFSQTAAATSWQAYSIGATLQLVDILENDGHFIAAASDGVAASHIFHSDGFPTSAVSWTGITNTSAGIPAATTGISKFAATEDTVIAVTTTGEILHSITNGQSWSLSLSAGGVGVGAASIGGVLAAFFNDGRLVASKDNGLTWEDYFYTGDPSKVAWTVVSSGRNAVMLGSFGTSLCFPIPSGMSV